MPVFWIIVDPESDIFLEYYVRTQLHVEKINEQIISKKLRMLTQQQLLGAVAFSYNQT